jgi:hypothetical protein
MVEDSYASAARRLRTARRSYKGEEQEAASCAGDNADNATCSRRIHVAKLATQSCRATARRAIS